VKKTCFVFIVALFFVSAVFGQAAHKTTAANELPAISVVGDMTAKASSDEDDGEVNKVDVRAIEFAFQGYLLPDVRTDIILAAHKHGDEFEIELEEANVTFLNLFNTFGLKAGRVLPDIGKINKVHQHHWAFVDAPLVLENFLGDHGLMGDGVSLSWLTPLPFFLQVEAGAYRIPEEHDHDEEEGCGHIGFSLADYAYTLKLWAGFEIAADTELEIGLSGVSARGSHYEHHLDNVKLAAADLTLKSVFSAYQKIIFRNEIFYLKRELPIGIMENYGMYSYLGFDIDKYINLGARYDWSENAYPKTSSKHDKESRIAAIFTYSFSEATKLRLQYNYIPERETHEGYVQVLFGIGPHSHPLE